MMNDEQRNLFIVRPTASSSGSVNSSDAELLPLLLSIGKYPGRLFVIASAKSLGHFAIGSVSH
jgi:hypothetical protein